MQSTYELFFDGGKKSNNVTYGYVIYKDRQEVYRNNGKISHTIISSNAAEYLALIFGMVACLQLGAQSVNIKGDSQLIIYQVLGKYKAKSPILTILKILSRELLKMFDEYTLEWIPREQNKEADGMTS